MSAESQATVAEQEYLETIFWLYEAGLPMTGANIARAMQLSAPTVHEMIGRLERDGYITRGTDRSLSFTDSGREHAEHIVSRHRMIERFLTDVLGIPWDEVHEEAERIEHAMSPVLEERMFAAIGDAKTCPHGHPINTDPDPALRERGRGAPPLSPRPRRRAGARGHVRGAGRRRDHDRARRHGDLAHALGGRDGLGRRRPVAAAARRAARAAGDLQGPLRALMQRHD
jgi:Mn-dependent DtxR family transcriptional regulator